MVSRSKYVPAQKFHSVFFSKYLQYQNLFFSRSQTMLYNAMPINQLGSVKIDNIINDVRCTT